jgi:hypothetical protein
MGASDLPMSDDTERKAEKEAKKADGKLTEEYEKAVIKTAIETKKAGDIVAKKTKKTVKKLEEKIN